MAHDNYRVKEDRQPQQQSCHVINLLLKRLIINHNLGAAEYA